MSAKVEIVRDSAGVPSLITARDRRGHKAELTYRSDVGFEVRGKVSPEIAVLLALVPSFGKVAVDIVAQTIGNIAIDIAAQTVGNITVDLAAQSVGNVAVDLAANTLGNLTVDIAAQSVGNFNIDIAEQSVGNLGIDIKAQTLAHLHTDIVAQSIGNLGVDIKAQTIGNINVALAAATATVTITGGVTITTTGGTNIVIDKLTQEAFTPRHVVFQNDNGVASPNAPPSNTSSTYYGKWFPRSMRGLLRGLGIYCKRTAAGTLTLSYAPEPGMGATGSVTITPGAGWDWKETSIGTFWNYDPLFVWISACSADVSWGYDSTTPYDMFNSADSGVTWNIGANRLFVYARVQGLTVGDLPVSGTVNNIPIPNATSARQKQSLGGAGVAEFLDTEQTGAGYTLIVIFSVDNDDSKDHLTPRVYCDGVSVLPDDLPFNLWQTELVNQYGDGIRIGVWDSTNHYYSLIVTVHYPFKRSLKIGFLNDEVNAHTGYVSYSYEKIS